MAGVGSLRTGGGTVLPQLGELVSRQSGGLRELLGFNKPSCMVAPGVGERKVVLLEWIGLLGAAENIDIANEEFAPPIDFGMSLSQSLSESKLVNEFFDTDDRSNLNTVFGATVPLNPNLSSFTAGPLPTLQLTFRGPLFGRLVAVGWFCSSRGTEK